LLELFNRLECYPKFWIPFTGLEWNEENSAILDYWWNIEGNERTKIWILEQNLGVIWIIEQIYIQNLKFKIICYKTN
jgi:hypothetical protein